MTDVMLRTPTVSGARSLLRWSGGLAIGLVSGLFVVLALATTSGWTLTHDRLLYVARDALRSGELAFNEHRDEDYFTECSILTMQYLRRDGVFQNALQTQFSMQAAHPCQDLEALVTTGRLPRGEIPSPGPYVNYPFGSRYLEAFVLSLLDLHDAKTLYAVLSYGSVLILFAGAFRNSASTALTVLPIGLFLLFGFGQHRFGHNLAHAPGFFVGFTALGVFLAARERFRDPAARVKFFGFLGVLIAFFDMLHGSIPVVLSLSIVLNHLFYVAPEARSGNRRSTRGYWLLALEQSLAISVCYLVSYAVLTAARLWLLSRLLEGGWHRVTSGYGTALAIRLGDQISGHVIRVNDVIEKLWTARFQLAAGGAEAATLGIFLALSAWILALCLLPVACRGLERAALLVLADATVVAFASVGVLTWYRLFLQHTWIHVLFIVRIAALPAAYGCVAAILLTRFLARARTPSILWAIAGGVVVSCAASTFLLEGGFARVTAARFVELPEVDSVTCAPLGLESDGKRDGLVELSLVTRQVSPPLAFLGVAPGAFSPLSLTLERVDPPGWWDTGRELYILGVSQDPNGALLNRPDGMVRLPPGHLSRLWAHLCRDDHDTPRSAFVLHTGQASMPVPGQP